MVQKKHQKSKQKKHQPHAKKQGKQADISEFCAQLDVLGLKVIQVTADGNCFFRALADQLEGNQEVHEKYRGTIVQYIMKNREMFEPFIEDGFPFDEYCHLMEKDGTWAGNMELQAASLVTRTNICIHRHKSPRWYIQNFDIQGARMIHLSYHDGEHYNSLRMKEDPCDGPAKVISIKADVNLTASSQRADSPGAHSRSKTSKHDGAINMVMAVSKCNDAEKIEQILQLVDGDIDAAVEFLIAERDYGETNEQNSLLFEDDDKGCDQNRNSNQVKGPKGCDKDRNSNKLRGQQGSKNKKDKSFGAKKVVNGTSSSEVDKKVPRNQACPCGSKKKYKSCCGTAAGRNSKLVIENEALSARGKRGKQGKKVAAVSNAPASKSYEALPDLGALCI